MAFSQDLGHQLWDLTSRKTFYEESDIFLQFIILELVCLHSSESMKDSDLQLKEGIYFCLYLYRIFVFCMKLYSM